MFTTGIQYYTQGKEIWSRSSKELVAVVNNKQDALMWAEYFNDREYTIAQAANKLRKG